MKRYWKKTDYWAAKVPIKMFDFIGVHYYCGHYGISSPMCLINLTLGTRPVLERRVFQTKVDVLRAARRIAKLHDLIVVDCTTKAKDKTS